MRIFTLVVVALLSLPLFVQAQGVSSDQIRQLNQEMNTIDRQQRDLPKFPNIDLQILSPEKSAVPKAVDEIEFDFQGVEIEGMRHFPKSEGEAFFAPLLNKKTGLSAIRDAALALENKYRERGFFLVRVFVPPQQVNSGIFKIKVIEGYVAQVFVEGPNAAMNELVEAYAKPVAQLRPLDLAGLERVLLMINDIPGIAGTAVLRPAAVLGASDLVITVAPLADAHIGTTGNTGSKSTGPYALGYIGIFQQPFNSKGQVTLSLTATGRPEGSFEGVRSVVSRYSQAIGSRGLIASFGLTRSQAKPGDYLSSLDIESNAYSISPRLRFPLLRTRESSVYLDGGLAVNNSETTIAGAMLTNDRMSVADLGASWVLNGWMNGVQSLGVGVSRGMPLFGAMKSEASLPSTAGFQPEFMKYTMTWQRTQTLPQRFSLRMFALGQYSQDRLLTGEQIVFGASTIGRGFTPALIAGDKGLGALLELRYDLAKDLGARVSSPQLYVSADWANAKTVASASVAATSSTINSTAIGLRLVIDKKTQIDFRFASANQQIDTNDTRRNNKLFFETVTQF